MVSTSSSRKPECVREVLHRAPAVPSCRGDDFVEDSLQDFLLSVVPRDDAHLVFRDEHPCLHVPNVLLQHEVHCGFYEVGLRECFGGALLRDCAR